MFLHLYQLKPTFLIHMPAREYLMQGMQDKPRPFLETSTLFDHLMDRGCQGWPLDPSEPISFRPYGDETPLCCTGCLVVPFMQLSLFLFPDVRQLFVFHVQHVCKGIRREGKGLCLIGVMLKWCCAKYLIFNIRRRSASVFFPSARGTSFELDATWNVIVRAISINLYYLVVRNEIGSQR